MFLVTILGLLACATLDLDLGKGSPEPPAATGGTASNTQATDTTGSDTTGSDTTGSDDGLVPADPSSGDSGVNTVDPIPDGGTITPPSLCILAGYPDEDAPIEVDDDLEVQLEGEVIYHEADGSRSVIEPIYFFAGEHQVLRIIATDANWCERSIGPLWLKMGAEWTELTDGACESLCPQSRCYLPDAEMSWPAVFFDESYTL